MARSEREKSQKTRTKRIKIKKFQQTAICQGNKTHQTENNQKSFQPSDWWPARHGVLRHSIRNGIVHGAASASTQRRLSHSVNVSFELPQFCLQVNERRLAQFDRYSVPAFCCAVPRDLLAINLFLADDFHRSAHFVVHCFGLSWRR